MRHAYPVGSLSRNGFAPSVGNLSDFRPTFKADNKQEATYRVKPTQAIEDLFRLDAEGCETGDFTDAFLD